MSSILKALEKVDESQRSRRPAGTGGLPKGRGRRPAWLIPAWALGGAAVATLATYAIMGGFSKPAAQVAPATIQVQPVQKEVEAPAQSVAAPAVKPTVAAKPAAEPVAKVAAKPAPGPATSNVAKPAIQPVSKTSAKPVTQSAAKATSTAVAAPQTSAKAAAKQLAQPAAKAGVLPAAVVQPAPVRQAAVQAAPAAPAAVASAPAAAQPAPQKSRPEIRVTGIAWQSNSESSFAMVNGRPMRQGNVVEGYKIEQIYEDSVRFSSSKGNSLVVPLGAGEE